MPDSFFFLQFLFFSYFFCQKIAIFLKIWKINMQNIVFTHMASQLACLQLCLGLYLYRGVTQTKRHKPRIHWCCHFYNRHIGYKYMGIFHRNFKKKGGKCIPFWNPGELWERTFFSFSLTKIVKKTHHIKRKVLQNINLHWIDHINHYDMYLKVVLQAV